MNANHSIPAEPLIPKLRKTASIIFAALALLFAWAALTVPMIASAGPAIFMVVFAAGAWIAWPKHRA